MILLIGLSPSVVRAAGLKVRVNEILAGVNGDSSIQFVELAVQDDSQKKWGPQPGEKVGRTRLIFGDASGKITGRFVFPSDPPPGASTVLVATADFAALTGVTPDFIMPRSIVPNIGSVAFENNPDAGPVSETFQVSLNYGGASSTGPFANGTAANPNVLAILGVRSLRRFQNFGNDSFGSSGQHNDDFVLAPPTPASTRALGDIATFERNLAGEVSFLEDTLASQGKNLFKRETFSGNGRTCQTCHLPMDHYALTPARIRTLPNSDPLFVHEQNVNRLVVTSAGSVWPSAPSGGAQPSDLAGVISGSLGGTATILAGTGGTYWIVGGLGLNVPGNIITDGRGNKGTIESFIPGNLQGPDPVNGSGFGLEASGHLRGPGGLVLVNVNGFSQAPFFRSPPSLLNVKHTAPYGLSGEFRDLEAFTTNAVKQHFTRRLERVEGLDFRPPTAEEINALVAFQESILFPLNQNFDETNRFERFLATDVEIHGRNVFFGSAKCSVCHSGKTLSHSDGRFGTTAGINESFDTGVSRLAFVTEQHLPPEQDEGQPAGTRRFNVPSLFGLKKTGPYFHNGSAGSLIGAADFYNRPEFKSSPSRKDFPSPEGVDARSISAFLRALGREPSTPPSIHQTRSNQTVNDNAWIMPFTETIISVHSPSQILEMIVEIDQPGRGSLKSASNPDQKLRPTFSRHGNASSLVDFLRSLEFHPRQGNLPPGGEERTTITLTLKDGINFPTVDSTTTITTRASNGALSISPLSSKIVSVGSVPPAIEFRVMGYGTGMSSSEPRARSSNPLLVRSEGLAISGSGGVYSLAITPVHGRRGVATITIEAGEGPATGRQSFELVMLPPTTSTFVGPFGTDHHMAQGGGFGSEVLAETDFRIQHLHPANVFPAGLLAIHKMGFRRVEYDSPSSATLGDLEITLSTGRHSPLSVDFASNLSEDATRVFRGPLTLSSTSVRQIPGGFPPYELSVPFDKPFVYFTGKGDLLIDLKNHAGSIPWILIDAIRVSPDRTLFEWSTDAATGLMSAYKGWTDITEFTASVLATPPRILPVDDQAVLTGTAMAEIPLTVTDDEMPAGELLLSATSSNSDLLDPATFQFAGSGSNRILRVPVPPHRSGVTRVTVSVHDGTFSHNTTFNIGLSQISQGTLIPIPPATATLWNWSFVSERREQTVVNANLFPSRPLLITEIRFKTGYLVGDFSDLPQLQVHLSTSAVDPVNHEYDETALSRGTLVYQGPIRKIAPDQIASQSSPAFDLTIPLERPFYYRPEEGHLLIDIENSAGQKSPGMSGPAGLAVLATERRFANGAALTTTIDSGLTPHSTSYNPSVMEVYYFVSVPPPRRSLILESPRNQHVTVGGPVSFSVLTTASSPLRFQWLHNGNWIVGTDAATLFLPLVKSTDRGSYAVVVSDGETEETSGEAVLTIDGGELGFEADVLPRPGGKNSGAVMVSDWVKIGRFVAGLDKIENAREFRRVDCAPSATRGDGRITIADWVQAGRYAAGLDLLPQAGGPDEPPLPTP